LKDETEKLESRLTISRIIHNQAVNACRIDLAACPSADLARSYVDEDTADLGHATAQASLFLKLTVAVPIAIAVLWLGLQGLARSRRSRMKDERLSA